MTSSIPVKIVFVIRITDQELKDLRITIGKETFNVRASYTYPQSPYYEDEFCKWFEAIISQVLLNC